MSEKARRIVEVLRLVRDHRSCWGQEFWADCEGIRRVAGDLEGELGYFAAWRQACGEWVDGVLREPEPHTHPFDSDLPPAGGC